MQLLILTFANVLFFIISGSAWAVASNTPLPWAGALGDVEGIMAIEAVASVKVSDGKTYKVHTAWRNGERSIFHRIYPDRVVTMAREGLIYWSWDGQTQSEIAGAPGDVIEGHQFHARLLFLDGVDRSGAKLSGTSEICACENYRVTTEGGMSLTMHYEKASGRAHTLVMQSEGSGRIVIKYHDWRPVNGVSLPWQITIDHDGRRFDYRFQSINLNGGELWDSLHPPMEKLTPDQQLMALHRLSIDAHIESDINLLKGRWADEVLNLYGGNAVLVDGFQMEESLGQSLSNRVHRYYRDKIKPIVRVSADGTMGTVAAEVEAAGDRLEGGQPTGESFAFQSAWLATYEKKQGGWKMTGIASGVAHAKESGQNP